MFKKTVTYTDFDGCEQKEDLYFNVTARELVEMDVAEDGNLPDKLQSIVDSNDIKQIYYTFKNLILSFYGVKSEDGKRFIKNDEIREEFEQSAAFDELLSELMGSGEAAANFMSAIIDPAIKKLKADKNGR